MSRQDRRRRVSTPRASSRPPSGTPEDQMLRDMERRVRAAYVTVKQATYPESAPFIDHHVPSWDGGVDRNGTHHESVWPGLAAFMLQHSLDPALFFRAQIVNEKLLPPNTLGSARALSRYVQFQAEERAAIKVRLSCEATAFTRAVRDAAAWFPTQPTESWWMFALLNEAERMTPLFRYCMGRELNMPQVYSRYEEQARWQLLVAFDAYCEHWQRILPADFIASVAARRQAAGGR